MSQGILNITTSISGQQITPILITSPLNTQTLVHNGTRFVNDAVPNISLIQHDAFEVSGGLGIYVTAVGGTTPVVYTNTTPTTLTLNPGTYSLRAVGIVIPNQGGSSSLYFVKTGGSGTFTSTFYSNGYFTGNSSTGGLLVTGDTYFTLDGLGTIIVSTASVTIALAASSVTVGNIVNLNSIRFSTIRIA